uniref:SAM-dependent methyltransferase TRM5/TYW2-type domain-containing protein n=1 Tax=Arcella intermedia TaxID=1963864 RepID=A0A6B2LHN2_9EUKA
MPMELIAGEDNTMVTLTESGCTFRFDFKNVFWNSRLENEHRRLISLCKPGEIICDVFAGVGPFAVPLARKGSIVYANDLNEHCYNALLENAKANLTSRKISNLKAYCLDGREFLQTAVNEICCTQKKAINHIFMNLPKTAFEFLDVLIGLFPEDIDTLPIIHCYCFANGPDHKQDATQKVHSILKFQVDPLQLYQVRVTSADCIEYCATFRLPKEIAYKAK